MPAGVGDDSFVDDVCRADDDCASVVLQRMHFEFDTRNAVMCKWTDLEGVQCRGSGPCVDFDLDAIDADVRQSDPFSPSDGQQILILTGQ